MPKGERYFFNGEKRHVDAESDVIDRGRNSATHPTAWQRLFSDQG